MFRTRFFWQISGSLLILSCTVAAVVTILFSKIVEKESLETRTQDLTGKISTGYKPKIRELEDKIKEME